MQSKQSQAKIFSVSTLNNAARRQLESEFGSIWVIGEVSGLTRPASGHWYFTLKDEGAQLRSAMFRGNNRTVKFPIANGQQVLVRGRLSLYEPRGDYQLIAEHMEPAGDGLLKQQFEQLKMRLAGEGLFNQGYKKPLPEHIQRVGVITSPTGAAVHDILTVLKRRAPQLDVLIYPAMVQGEAAIAQLVNSIETADRRKEVDVIIIGRGGGSLEDLWCFNEEAVARAIFHCQTPIVSAVGHEVDVTIADFVADYRAATPSAAAELISPNMEEVKQQWQHWQHRLQHMMVKVLQSKQHDLTLLNQRLQHQHPQQVLQRNKQENSELLERLLRRWTTFHQQHTWQLDALSQRVQQQNPQRTIASQQQTLEDLADRLRRASVHDVARKQQQLAALSARLDSISPLATLSRGYSITTDTNNHVLTNSEQVNVGDNLQTTLENGKIISQVQQVLPNR